jgi:hypothetical protein
MNWETRHEKLYKGGVLIQHRVQRTPDGPWEDYVPEEPPPVNKAQPKAFPNLVGQLGMDLRDYFAAQAMQAMVQASASLNVKDDDKLMDDCSFETAVACGFNSEILLHGTDKEGKDFRYTWAQYYAEEAYLIADAMMKAREE